MKCVRSIWHYDGVLTRVDEAQKEYVCRICKSKIYKNNPYISKTYRTNYKHYFSEKYCIHCAHNIFKNQINTNSKRKYV